MAEDAEDRFKRAMDRLFSSPPPPSNAGRDKKESSTGIKSVSPSINRTTRPSWSVESSPLEGNLSSNLHQVCRPWDRGDLFRRLGTFKSMTWFGKPEVAGPVNCARNGWVNVDADLIACEGCNAMLSFPCPPSWSQHEVESAAAFFSEKLDSGHKAFCPWKENSCSEILAQFPPTPAEVLAEGFKDRCDALYQLSALPVLSSSIVDYLKRSKGLKVERFISQPASNLPLANGTDAIGTYFQAQRIISLCGWELRLLPYVVDCEDDNTDILRKNPPSSADSKAKYRRPMESGPKVLLYSSKKQKVDQNRERSNKFLAQEPKCDVGSAVLDCTLCGASVGLWLFSKIPRPSSWITAEALRANTAPMACEFSSASGIERGSCEDQKGEKTEKSDNGADAATSGLSKLESKPANVLTLKLTIAGGPRPTQLCSHDTELLLPCLLQPGSSRTGSKITKPFEDEGIKHVGQVGSLTGNKLSSSAICGEKGGNGRIMIKRKRAGDGGLDERGAMERNLRILPCLSSVDAVDTCFVSRRENSAESVEMPQERHQSTVMSVEDSDCITQRSMSNVAAEHNNSRKEVVISGLKGNTSPMMDSEGGIEETASEALMDGNRVGATLSSNKNVAFDESEIGNNDRGREGEATLVHNRRMSTEGSIKGHDSATEALCPPEKSSSFKKLCDESTREFDPVLQHRHFCPWVNTNLGRGSCGWQLTLDALEASPVAVRSDSASSMYKADPLSSVRKIFGRSPTGHKASKKQ